MSHAFLVWEGTEEAFGRGSWWAHWGRKRPSCLARTALGHGCAGLPGGQRSPDQWWLEGKARQQR